jgi:phospholipid/cholesterol/gamma-HCH transport system ATP-binding protein
MLQCLPIIWSKSRILILPTRIDRSSRASALEIPRGKVVAIMGGSGCGKTTLLRLIGGQLKPSRGEVLVDGLSVPKLGADELYALRRRMGMLFQFGALFTDISVFDNVAYQMREHTDLPEELIRDMVLMKLNAVGLRGAHQLMPAELSGGMARRVALARAIALDPMLIMYDEPFAGLDPISLGVIGQLIRKLNDALGATTIMVTHDIQESLLIVDFIYFMSDGKVVALGTPDEIRASKHPFVHQFVFAEADGPVPFHYPAAPLAQELLGKACPMSQPDPEQGAMLSAISGLGHRVNDALQRLGFATRFFVMLLLWSGQSFRRLSSDHSRDLFFGFPVAADHHGFRPVHRHGARHAGLRNAAALRLGRRTRRSGRPVAGAGTWPGGRRPALSPRARVHRSPPKSA